MYAHATQQPPVLTQATHRPILLDFLNCRPPPPVFSPAEQEREGGGRGGTEAGREEDRSEPTEGDQEYDTGVCLHRSLELSSTSKTIFVPLW